MKKIRASMFFFSLLYLLTLLLPFYSEGARIYGGTDILLYLFSRPFMDNLLYLRIILRFYALFTLANMLLTIAFMFIKNCNTLVIFSQYRLNLCGLLIAAMLIYHILSAQAVFSMFSYVLITATVIFMLWNMFDAAAVKAVMLIDNKCKSEEKAFKEMKAVESVDISGEGVEQDGREYKKAYFEKNSKDILSEEDPGLYESFREISESEKAVQKRNAYIEGVYEKLTGAEKTEMQRLFVNIPPGALESLPLYNIGGDNRIFYARLFSNIDRYALIISVDLLEKLYSYVTGITKDPARQSLINRKMIKILYSKRLTADTLKRCEEICRKDIDLNLIKNGAGKGSYIYSYEKLVMLLTAQKRYLEALNLCEKAVSIGLESKFENGYKGRAEILRKKAGKKVK